LAIAIFNHVVRAAFVELVACWAVWFYPFVFHAMRIPGRKPAVTVRSTRWGFALQFAAYGVAWAFPLPDPGPARAAASMALAPAAVVLAWTAVRHLGRQWRIHAGLYEDHELVRTGPYRFVRHPIYASMLALLLATAALRAPWHAFLAALAIFLAGTEIRVRAEDRLLAGRFGAAFQDYRTRVPAYVPLLR
jgi:protein-S-isoprenylcysteine O-methyltransferase Ste14